MEDMDPLVHAGHDGEERLPPSPIILHMHGVMSSLKGMVRVCMHHQTKHLKHTTAGSRTYGAEAKAKAKPTLYMRRVLPTDGSFQTP